MSNFMTDDEDSPQEESDVIEESIAESSCLESENGSNMSNLTGAIKKNVRRSSASNKVRSSIMSDSDSSPEHNVHTYTNKHKSSKHRTPSFRNKSTDSPSSSTSTEVLRDSHFQDKLNVNSTSHRKSFMKTRSPELSSDDSDDNIRFQRKTKKKIISDSESEEEIVNISNGFNKEEQVSGSIEVVDTDPEIENITKSFNASIISSEINFGKKGNIINSTLVDTESQNTPKAGSKRLFNKSVDTPRILKHLKESTTPISVTPSKVIQKQGNDSMLTPRNVRAIIPSRSPSPSNSLEIVSEGEADIIDISSGDVSPPPPPARRIDPKKKIVKQTTLDTLITNKNMNSPTVVMKQDKPINAIEVCPREMSEQKTKINKIEQDLLKAKNLLNTVNLDSLPDKGKLIRDRHMAIEQMLKQEIEKLSIMVVTKDDTEVKTPGISKKAEPTWDEIQMNANAVMPKTFGKMAMSTYNAQKAVTMDRLQQLHGSLESCPKENDLAEDPKGLKVDLMPHQKRALAWLMWREKQKPSGGILADDMGLGKTLTMISLMIKSLEVEDDESDEENQPTKYKGGMLVVCPASLLNQWSGELERRTKRGLVSCELYHGPKRETKPKRLAEHDMVITTYAIVMNECEKNGAVFRVKWRRIVVDEAHQIRNYKSQTSDAVCRLAAESRWALTGTPVHNKELDMYALLKFLRCSPFDDLAVWKRWVGDKSTGGQERLHTVISSLMLRRTKTELMEKGTLQCMPDRKWELISVELSKTEMDVYQKILLFSRTLFAQFLHQRAEKNQDAIDLKYTNFATQPNGPNQEYFKMREKLLRVHKVKDIKQHDILVLLLRLRQICCHPSLITNMLHEDMEEVDEDGDLEETNILDQLNKLVLNDDHDTSNPAEGLSNQEDAPRLKEAAKTILNLSNPVFSKERLSSKIKAVLDVIKEKIVKTDDKAIIVSQWPSFLRLIAYHLDKERIPFDQLDGSIPVNKRMIMVDKFNSPSDKMKILLLSLTAGGVGLNLIGANYLFLLDLHWNPQLENQAQDRIYRVGQQKPVFVYKFMASDTIEKRILDLQEKKLDIANSMLTGTKQVTGSKLSLNDLKLLFEM
ncbi:transcription termination factor 2 [Anoplophora glabripennis]|uniref:transcription termination factor 2 n=1 Tax=Anoplophora glabripennis TaxID=217634 RepID=UPI000874153F|nr:transcription termination factor 2 [Anoplophora glabripennis]